MGTLAGVWAANSINQQDCNPDSRSYTKLLVSPLRSTIRLPYMIQHMSPLRSLDYSSHKRETMSAPNTHKQLEALEHYSRHFWRLGFPRMEVRSIFCAALNTSKCEHGKSNNLDRKHDCSIILQLQVAMGCNLILPCAIHSRAANSPAQPLETIPRPQERPNC